MRNVSIVVNYCLSMSWLMQDVSAAYDYDYTRVDRHPHASLLSSQDQLL